MTVIAGCLDEEGEGAKRLMDQSKGRIHVIKLDITKQNDIDRCSREIMEICKDKGELTE